MYGEAAPRPIADLALPPQPANDLTQRAQRPPMPTIRYVASTDSIAFFHPVHGSRSLLPCYIASLPQENP